MKTFSALMEGVAAFYDFVGRVGMIALGWAILWGNVQLLVHLAWSL